MKDRSRIGRDEANRQKGRVRFNAFRNGLTGQTVVLSWEDHENYQSACRAFFDDLRPEGEFERQLVQTIADATWRLNRAAVLETNLFAITVQGPASAMTTDDTSIDSALAMAVALRDEGCTLANVSMYCQRISRQRDAAAQQLRDLQARRRFGEAREQPKTTTVKRSAAAHGFDFANRETARRRPSHLELVKPVIRGTDSPDSTGNCQTSLPDPQFPESPRVS